MKILSITFAIMSISILVSCDVQSDITKKSVEKYGPTPTPSISPTPTEVPIDPADVVQVDTTLEGGPSISVNRPTDKKNIVCDKYNRVMVNTNDNVVTIKGACRQIMLNGDRNDVTAEAVTEIVFNGSENKVRYTRYANGKRPVASGKVGENLSEKATAPAAK